MYSSVKPFSHKLYTGHNFSINNVSVLSWLFNSVNIIYQVSTCKLGFNVTVTIIVLS